MLLKLAVVRPSRRSGQPCARRQTVPAGGGGSSNRGGAGHGAGNRTGPGVGRRAETARKGGGPPMKLERHHRHGRVPRRPVLSNWQPPATAPIGSNASWQIRYFTPAARGFAHL